MPTETANRQLVYGLESLKRINRDAGQHYFSPDTMRFFRSRVMCDLFHGERWGVWGVYFVTSEQDHSPMFGTGPRLYSVRWMALEDGEGPDPWRDDETRPVSRGHVYNASEFQEYASRSGALKAAERHARTAGVDIPRNVW